MIVDLHKPNPYIKFYGIYCNVFVEDNEESFQLIGKYKITQFLLDTYALCIWGMINLSSLFLDFIGIEHEPHFYYRIYSRKENDSVGDDIHNKEG